MNSITWASLCPKVSMKWMSFGSGMWLLLGEEVFVLGPLWWKYHGSIWLICLSLSNYQTKVKIWNGLKPEMKPPWDLDWMRSQLYEWDSVVFFIPPPLVLPKTPTLREEHNQFKLKNNLCRHNRDWENSLKTNVENTYPKKILIPFVAETRLFYLNYLRNYFNLPFLFARVDTRTQPKVKLCL
jgi:hypothetical protein